MSRTSGASFSRRTANDEGGRALPIEPPSPLFPLLLWRYRSAPIIWKNLPNTRAPL
jgi:hypothetical protein